jgi:hypothetical protein
MGMACLQFGVRGRGEGIGRADPGPAEESDELYSEDPSAVMTAVHGVGLDGHTNTSYPRGLAALVTGPSPYAVIDVGTNSVKFHVGERHPDGNWRAIADRAEVTRLGENLEHAGAISAEPLDLARLDGRPRPDALVAMGGAVTHITAVKLGLATYDPDLVQGAVLDRAEIDRQIELYWSRDAEARRAIVGLQPSAPRSSWPARLSSGRSWTSWDSRP